MTDIKPCERSVVMVTSKLSPEVVENLEGAMIDWGGFHRLEWDVNRPDDSLEQLGLTLDGAQRVIIEIVGGHKDKNVRAYEKAVRAVVSRSNKKGFIPYVLDDQWSHLAQQITAPFEFVAMNIDRRDDHGPFDMIGDIHGCAIETAELLDRLGYMQAGWQDLEPNQFHTMVQSHAEGRKTILLGDLVDRGPMNLAAMLIARRLEELGGLRVIGNHDAKIGKWLAGRNVNVGPHQQPTIDELKVLDDAQRAEWSKWMMAGEGHYILDGGRLVVAHAGIDEDNQGRITGGAMSFALYGKPDPEGRLDEDGYPISQDWAQDYQGEATVVHGHVVYDQPRKVNNVIALDTGCVFGGTLTALRWPEMEYVVVKAKQEWWRKR